MVISTPSLQYPTSESSASSSQGALAEGQLAASLRGSSSDSINSSLLHAVQAYLKALDNELHFHVLVGALADLRTFELARSYQLVSSRSACRPLGRPDTTATLPGNAVAVRC